MVPVTALWPSDAVAAPADPRLVVPCRVGRPDRRPRDHVRYRSVWHHGRGARHLRRLLGVTTRALLDPGLVQFVDAFPQLDLSPSGRTAWRAASRPAASSPSRPDVETSEVLVPRAGDEGPVRVLVSRPVKLPGPPLPAIVWLHGGGFVIGSPEQDQRLLERIAGDVGCVVAAPDYRLAPETPYPGALRDCSAVLRWLHEQPDRLGVDPTRLAVGGHSAGGGLAAAVALEARERGGPVLALQALVYPMLDDRTASQAPQERPFAGEFVWDHPTNAAAWGALLGESVGTPGVSPLAAPARAADLSKVAPSPGGRWRLGPTRGRGGGLCLPSGARRSAHDPAPVRRCGPRHARRFGHCAR